jgi:hypothetical protein
MRRALTIPFWFSFAAAIAVYAVMAGWSLPKISAAAGGAAPFDMRPMGYSFEEAKAFLAALGEDGRRFYGDVQHKLDLAYPALLSLALGTGIYLLSPERIGRFAIVLALLAVPGMVFDYVENARVSELLAIPAEAATAELVASASRATLLKSAFTTLTMTLALVLLVLRLVQRWRTRG